MLGPRNQHSHPGTAPRRHRAVPEERLPPWPPTPGPAFFSELQALMLDPSQGETGPRALAPQKKKQLFEAAYADFCGRRHCLAVNSGTTALDLAVEALALAPDDVVVAADYGHPSTVRWAACHHRLRLIDVGPHSLCLSAAALEAALQDGAVRAVLATHFAGLGGDIDPIAKLCEQAEIALIEDASHAHGAEFRGRKAGAFGRLGCFSLHATKNLSSGEGGAVCLDDEALFQRLWRLHDIGRGREAGPYAFDSLGGNYRLSEAASLEALHRLRELPVLVSRRHAAADRLLTALDEQSLIEPLRPEPGDLPGWHIFAAWYQPERCGGLSRKRFILSMCSEGIPCNAGWPVPLSGLEAIEPYAEPTVAPTAARACREIVWFDGRLLLAEHGVEHLLEALDKVAKGRGARQG